MFATGIGIPIMAALNADLGARTGSPWLATFILFVVGAVVSGAALALVGLPSQLELRAPPQFFLGGTLVAFYVLSVTLVAPRIGVANAIFFVLIGQMASAAAVDHFGLFGAMQSPITLRRVLGLGCMTL